MFRKARERSRTGNRPTRRVQARIPRKLDPGQVLTTSSIQPTKLARAFLRTSLEHPADESAFLGRALIHWAAAKIAFPVVQEPETYLAVFRALRAGNVRSASVWRGFVHYECAFELCFAIRAWDSFEFGSEF